MYLSTISIDVAVTTSNVVLIMDGLYFSTHF